MTDLLNVKAGDTLLIYTRWNKRLAKAERVTPSGRVIVGTAQFDPSGYERGSRGFDRCRARPATDDDIAGINRSNLVAKLSRFPWDKLPADDLKRVGEIVATAKINE